MWKTKYTVWTATSAWSAMACIVVPAYPFSENSRVAASMILRRVAAAFSFRDVGSACCDLTLPTVHIILERITSGCH